MDEKGVIKDDDQGELRFCGPVAIRKGWSWKRSLLCCSCSCCGLRDSRKILDIPHYTGEEPRKVFCVIKQREKCSFCAICAWFFTLLLLSAGIFLLVLYWSCISLPEQVLGDEFKPSTIPAVAARESQGVISVLSWNVFLRSDFVPTEDVEKGGEFKEERLDDILNLLDDYDILLFQETWSVWDNGRKKKLVETAQEKGFHYYIRSACVDSINKPMDGMLLIMSRHPISAADETVYETSEKIDKWSSKGALFARIKYKGLDACTIDAFTTHLQAGASKATITSQYNQLGDFVHSKMQTGNGNALVTGDFNTNGRDDNGSLTEKYFTMLDELSFSNTSAGYIARGSTFNTRNLLLEDVGENPPTGAGSVHYVNLPPEPIDGGGIDYAFFLEEPGSSEITHINGSAVADPFFQVGKPYLVLSDHVAVRFQLQCNLTAV